MLHLNLYWCGVDECALHGERRVSELATLNFKKSGIEHRNLPKSGVKRTVNLRATQTECRKHRKVE